jgi:hypothetical protein
MMVDEDECEDTIEIINMVAAPSGWAAYYRKPNDAYDVRPVACFVAQRVETEDEDGDPITFDVIRPYVMMPNGEVDDCEVYPDFAFVLGPGSEKFDAAKIEADVAELNRKMNVCPKCQGTKA